MTALLAVVATLAVTVFALAWLLAYFNGRYDELIGRSPKARYTSPWLRSMRGEREEDIRREVGISGVERIVILAVVVRRPRLRDLVLLLRRQLPAEPVAR